MYSCNRMKSDTYQSSVNHWRQHFSVSDVRGFDSQLQRVSDSSFPCDGGGVLSVLRIKCHSERSEESVYTKWTHSVSSLCSE